MEGKEANIKNIEINFKENCRGVSATFGKSDDKNFDLIFPKKIWRNYPNKIKSLWIDNFAHLSTICLPLVSGIHSVKYNTSFPLFRPFFHNMVLKDIPSATEDYNISTRKIIKQFENIKYNFGNLNIKRPDNKKDKDMEKRAITLFSCGKDSLLSLAVSKEINLKPVAIYINDTVSPSENKIKIEFCKKIAKEHNIKINFVKNNIEKINDFDFWNKDETCLSYSHMCTGFCFIALPFTHYYKAKYIVLGNQQDMNWFFQNKEGFMALPSYDQSSLALSKQNTMIKSMTNNKVNTISVIEPLTNLAIIKILHKRYPEFAKYEISCDSLNASNQKRWCFECSKCARLSLFMLAIGADPKTAGLKSLLGKKHKNLYCLFNGNEVDHYEKSNEARDQQLLAFYLAYKNNVKGYLMEKFKKEFLKEAQEREKELRKKFFTIYNSNIPKEIKRDIISIYKEELKELQ